MIFKAKVFIKNLWISISLVLAFVLNLYNWWGVLFHLKHDDGNFFLHYNMIFGVDLVGPWWKLLYLPIVGFLVILVNFGLGVFFYSKDKFLAITLAIMAVLVEIFITLGTVMAINLNL